MQLIGEFHDRGYLALAEAVMGFFDRRSDLQRPGVAFGGAPDKVSTDISLVAMDRSDPEAHGLAEAILRGVSVGLKRWLAERPLFLECCPERSLFVCPLFNLQRYAPGEGFYRWHCDWSLDPDATEPQRRVLAWILYCNSLPASGGGGGMMAGAIGAARAVRMMTTGLASVSPKGNGSWEFFT